MHWVGGNAWEEKERFIVQDSMRGHEEEGNKVTMAASPPPPGLHRNPDLRGPLLGRNKGKE